ncbi:MAG: S8 family serine peptidase, partial [Candidatus Sericytochromatia bacterium]|nr:S8 family serine peptidase [Candidatus Tanganyikabacteria bacterium]
RDASGSIDSCRGYNYDWVNAYRDIGHPGPDGHGHGTHVAGIIAAVGNNSGGSGGNIVGVAPAATILPVKTMDCNGDGQDWNIAYGIKASADQGAKVLNLSIGGPEPSPLLEDALGYAIAKGALVIVAAGNGQGSPVYYPAAYPGVIAVGAVDRDDAYQTFSNVGAQMGLVAPGGTINQSRDGILSTVPTYRSELSQSGLAYSRVSGTSQASPFVAGVAALIWSREPSLTADQIRTRLYATARDIGPAGFDFKHGWGRIDAVAALAATDHRFVAP